MPDKYYSVKYHMAHAAQGWSYQFYWFGASARLACDSAAGLITPLMQLHAPQVHLIAITATTAEKSDGRDTFKVSHQVGGIGNDNFSPDVSAVSALCRLYSSGTRHRTLWLRGLCDADVQRTDLGVASPSNSWRTRLEGENRNGGFFAGLAAQGFFIRSIKDPLPNTDYAWKTVARIEPEPDSEAESGIFEENTVVTVRGGAHGFPAGQVVTFSFPQDNTELLGYRGHHLLVDNNGPNAATTKFIINVKYRPRSYPLSPKEMKVRRVGYDYEAITGGQFVDFATRQTGTRPGPKGREAGQSFRH